jgi:hypothetical protein
LKNGPDVVEADGDEIGVARYHGRVLRAPIPETMTLGHDDAREVTQ